MTLTCDLSGKTAFVSGATSGLGRQFALTLARSGARVAVTGRRVDRLEALEEEIEAFDGRAMAIKMDVTDGDAIADAVEAAETELGPIGILVNNAGISKPTMAVKVTEEDFDEIMAVNVKGVFRLAQEVGKRMIGHGNGGRVIIIASIAAFHVANGLSTYGMSKAAVAHMTRILALEWARYGINVNAICPGYIETEMNTAYFATPEGQKMINSFPKKRLGKPEDLDGLLLLLASNASDYISGALFTADDAQSLGG